MENNDRKTEWEEEKFNDHYYFPFSILFNGSVHHFTKSINLPSFTCVQDLFMCRVGKNIVTHKSARNILVAAVGSQAI